MNIQERLKGIKGHLKIEHRGPDGKLKEVREIDNLILTDGLEIFADLLVGSGGTQINPGQTAIAVIAAGSDNTAPTVADTDLVTPLPSDRAVTVNSQPSSALARFVANFTAGIATGTWRELVLADTDAAKGARKCASRVVFGDMIKGALDTIAVTWEITFS